MSLKGLQDASVVKVYHASLADAGGWFFLKYTSRDGVDIHSSGSGGIADARSQIAEYADPSPLYGFLVYRRRKMLVKYVPDGTSRLMQARVAVHFTTIEETFSHDNVLDIKAPTDLTDAALSASLSLHSAADSTRSSAASQQPKSRLDEIHEDPKERQSYDARDVNDSVTATPRGRNRSIPSPIELPPKDTLSDASQDSDGDEEQSRPKTRDASRKAAAILGIPLDHVSSASIESAMRRPSITRKTSEVASLYAASVRSIPHSEYAPYLADPSRTSSSTARRPSLSEFDDLFSGIFLSKPKIKLGPRPTVDAFKIASAPRSKASLPHGMRMGNARDRHQPDNTPDMRPASRASVTSRISVANTQTPLVVPAPSPIPEVPQMPPPPSRPNPAPTSARSMPATLASRAENSLAERKRLRKAMELRKRQMLAATKNRGSLAVVSAPEPVPEELPSTPCPTAAAENAGDAVDVMEDRTQMQAVENTEALVVEAPEPVPEEASTTQSPIAAAENADVEEIMEDRPEQMLAAENTGTLVVEAPEPVLEEAPTTLSPIAAAENADVEEIMEDRPEQMLAAENTEALVVEAPSPVLEEASTIQSPIAAAENADVEEIMEDRPEQMLAAENTGTLTVVTVPSPVLEEAPTIQCPIAAAENAGDVEDVMEDRPEAHVMPTAQEAAPRPGSEVEKEKPSKVTEPTLPEPEPELEPEPEPSTDEPIEEPVVAPASETPTDTQIPDSHVRNPSRSSGDHVKADSGVELEANEVPEPRPEPDAREDNHAHDISSSPPMSMEHSSDLPSTRPSSFSEGDDETKTADALAETVAEARPGGKSQPEMTVVEPAMTLPRERRDSSANGEQSREDAVEALGTPSVEDADKLSDSTLGVDTCAATSESDVDTSDDEYATELRNAEIQEAKPIRVTGHQSPLAAFFPAAKTASNTSKTSIASSTIKSVASSRDREPSSPPRTAPTTRDSDNNSPPRPIAANLPLVNIAPEQRAANITVAKKVNISSGISQRIRALAARNSSPIEPPPMHRIPSRDSSGQSIVALRASSLKDATPPPLPRPISSSVSSVSSTRERSLSRSKTPSPLFDVPQLPQFPISLPSSHAVGPPSHPRDEPNLVVPLQATPVEPRESPPVVEHGAGLEHRESPSVTLAEAASRTTPSPSHTPTASPSKIVPRSPFRDTENEASRASFPVPRSSSDSTWRNTISHTARRLSESRSPTTTAIRTSSSSHNTGTDAPDDNGGDDAASSPGVTLQGRGSKSYGILRRMSNSINLGRKTPTPIVTSAAEERRSLTAMLARTSEEESGDEVEIGDVNVQLPDTLLWKRRWVSIDAGGNFVVTMSKSNAMASSMGNARSWHLSEFSRPQVPDQERMEMPNSVVLEYRVGGTLQVATETGEGRDEVLALLVEAWTRWEGRRGD